MTISYNKLWKMLVDLGLKKYQLRELAQISSNTMSKLGRNEFVSTETLAKICECLHCNIGDICEFADDASSSENG